MKRTMICIAACVLLAGCANKDAEKVAQLQGQIKTLEESQKQAEQRGETLQSQVTDLDGKYRDARSEAERLATELEREKNSGEDRREKLSERIVQLEAEVERLKTRPATEPVKPVDETKPTDGTTEEPKPDPEVKKQLEELLPLVKGGDRPSLGSAIKLLREADKETRDDYISRVQAWVKEEPDNKAARLALANILTTRFADLKDPMKMGALASQVKGEAEKALEIDPEYYDAVHFLAILKVRYPSFTPEFKDAPTTLDKAIKMQDSMTWEDRFGDVYAAYAMWYRLQGKLDDAGTWVQKGLDKAPRQQTLLDEQTAIEAAKAEEK